MAPLCGKIGLRRSVAILAINGGVVGWFGRDVPPPLLACCTGAWAASSFAPARGSVASLCVSLHLSFAPASPRKLVCLEAVAAVFQLQILFIEDLYLSSAFCVYSGRQGRFPSGTPPLLHGMHCQRLPYCQKLLSRLLSRPNYLSSLQHPPPHAMCRSELQCLSRGQYASRLTFAELGYCCYISCNVGKQASQSLLLSSFPVGIRRRG